MSNYHFVFKAKDNDFQSKGETFIADTPEQALAKFWEKNPNCKFLMMYDLHNISTLLTLQIEFAEKFKKMREESEL